MLAGVSLELATLVMMPVDASDSVTGALRFTGADVFLGVTVFFFVTLVSTIAVPIFLAPRFACNSGEGAGYSASRTPLPFASITEVAWVAIPFSLGAPETLETAGWATFRAERRRDMLMFLRGVVRRVMV